MPFVQSYVNFINLHSLFSGLETVIENLPIGFVCLVFRKIKCNVTFDLTDRNKYLLFISHFIGNNKSGQDHSLVDKES